ncbi:LNS2 domain-containing protein [Meloidogyne graminicola]|uniref:LNS2 domain-containing protein n=1 Tax=Meloidogyne graminicola TaxID=189291 RepID=A0A8S9ZPH3_9BILA|nr:LNS2 domain-containing protein [Meloidogyne graminicola]
MLHFGSKHLNNLLPQIFYFWLTISLNFCDYLVFLFRLKNYIYNFLEMNYVYYIFNNVKYLYNSMNSATLSGAIDVIVVEQPDGTYLSTPFHVRFGKYGVFNYDDKYVDIQINNEEIDLKMKLGGNGVAFFVEKLNDENDVPSPIETSPLPDGIDEADSSSLTPSNKENKGFIDQIKPVKRSPRKDSTIIKPRNGSSSSDDDLPLQKKTPQQQRLKKMLPFSSSIYSCRKNRSLPDLSILSRDYNQNDINSQMPSSKIMVVGEGENNKKKSRHKRKATFGAIDMQKIINENNSAKNLNIVGIIHQSKSASNALKNVTDVDLNLSYLETEKSLSPSVDNQKSFVLPPLPTEELNEELLKQKSNSPESSTTKTTFFCSSDEDEEGESSKDNLRNLPITSSVGSDIADGALSDPEIDRHGTTPVMNDPEWKWGEIPKSSKTKETKKSEKQGRWNWFRWSRQAQNDEEEDNTDVNKLNKNNLAEKKEEKQEGKGLYLQDFGNDPAKLEKYFGSGPMSNSGRLSFEDFCEEFNSFIFDVDFSHYYVHPNIDDIASTTSNFDSGKGVSLGASPSSALSINEDIETCTLTGIDRINIPKSTANSLENLQTTTDNTTTTATSIISTPTTTTIVESNKEKTKARNRFDSAHSDTSCATDLNLSDEEFLASTTDDLISGGSVKKYKRSLRLSSDQLKLLNLEYGSNDARFSAIDVIVVEQPDGTYLSTPFHVRFGKYGVFNYDDKYVDIQINNEEIDLKMKLGGNGVAFFVENNATNKLFKLLKLQFGANDARFSVTTKFQGTAWCSCHIYLLRWCDKLVISDIDGTITKSDVLGHVIPAIGGTWAHSGVAELYTRIKNNGYQMVYLSSRAIGQSHYTKTYLQSIAQGSQTLPDGPVLLSPTSKLLNVDLKNLRLLV